MVLAALIEKVFEPLHQVTPQDLTLKVLFLLDATSTSRVSEIHALSMDPPEFRGEGSQLTVQLVWIFV